MRNMEALLLCLVFNYIQVLKCTPQVEIQFFVGCLRDREVQMWGSAMRNHFCGGIIVCL